LDTEQRFFRIWIYRPSTQNPARKLLRVAACVMPLLLLSGCTPEEKKAAPAAAAAQAVAPPVTAAPDPPPAPEPPKPTVEQQRATVLVQQVEAAYTRGESDYRRGLLPEAKMEFDRAVDLLLSSGIDIRSNAQLQDELDHIVDKINALETEALKQGNGFVPQVEPSPSDVATDVTFQVDPNIVAKAKADLATTKSDLPLMVNDYVAAFINFFANTQRGHNTLLHSFQRSGHYRAMIQRVMAEEGVPQDLIYLAVAESGFQPTAINRKSHAGGMWQFMPRGNYGLARTSYVDERFDPEKSTRAYARYMKFLYDQLGDWYLAMAAYDWGAGNVQRAVQKTGYADFWELYKRRELPAETANYVPEILAAIIIANNPTQYGFDDVTLDPPILTDTVTVNYSVDIRLVSDMVGAPVDELHALNPSLLRMATPPDSPFDLHLPAGAATLFNERISLVPEDKRNAWRYRTVASGDTLASIAREYRIEASALASANQLKLDDTLSAVPALVVPVPLSLAPASRTRLYTVRRGDTLVTIADRFGVSLAELRRWNKLTGVKVEPGRRLRVAEPTVVQSSTTKHRRKSSSSSSSTSKASQATKSKSPSSKNATAKAEATGTKSTARKSTSKRKTTTHK
jgi:Soluble lytic murein transglycosylase and related regulatory proteins (some contain LysM/invasin domains)